jgi:hypothetical protein
MTDKRIQPPKEGLAGSNHPVGPGEGFIDGTTDVQGHSWTNPAPPTDFSPRTPTHGGELLPTDVDDDIEGQLPA